VVLPADHDLAKDVTTEIDVNALVGMTLVTPSPEDSPGYFERLNQLCAFAHFTPATLCPVNGLGNVLGMVAAGYGVTIMPEVVVSSPGPAWRTRRLCAPVPTMELKLVWLRASSSPGESLREGPQRANLNKADLTRADLRGAKLNEADHWGSLLGANPLFY
jgi:DNA-binding transcriptional LysR family regulator